MANFLILFINIFFNLLIAALFIRIILSWFQVSGDNFLVQILLNITNPILLPFQKIIPPIGMMDFSPIAAFIVLEIIRELLIFAVRLIF